MRLRPTDTTLELWIVWSGGGRLAVQDQHRFVSGKRPGEIAAIAFEVANALEQNRLRLLRPGCGRIGLSETLPKREPFLGLGKRGGIVAHAVGHLRKSFETARHVGLINERKLLSDEELQAPRLLHEVDVEVIDPAECKAVYEGLQVPAFSIGDTEICAIGPSGGKDSCFGDSGGPLVVAADNKRGYSQVGIVSWGPQCGNPLFPGVYTRVSSFADWIKANTGQ